MSVAAPNLGFIVTLGGFVLAFIFGAVANRTNFCTMGAVSDVVNMGSWGRMRMWLLAIAVAILGTHALQLAGLIDLTKYPQSSKAPDALLAIAAIQSEQGDSGSARNTLEDIIARFPSSEAAGKARTRLTAQRR